MDAEKYKLLFETIPSDAGIAMRQYEKVGELKKINDAYTLKSGCPFHGGREPGSFFVYPDGHYHCFSCGEHGRVIDFVSKIYGCSAYEAAEKIAEEEGLISGNVINKDYKPVIVKKLEVVRELNYPLMDKFYIYLQKWFGLSKKDEQILREERVLSLNRIRKDYFSFCDNGRDLNNLFAGFKKLYPDYKDEEIASVPGVYLKSGKLCLNCYNKGIGILIRNAEGTVVGVQIRRENVEEGQARYVWLSSVAAADWDNCSGGASCGSPQDVIYPVVERRNYKYNICIAEGKFKTEILAQQGNIAISVQGVGNYKGIDLQIIQIMKKVSVSGIYIFYDGDSLKNYGVFQNLRKLYFYLKETIPDLPVHIAVWNEVNGKGIDDLYLLHKDERLSKYLKYYTDDIFEMYDTQLELLEKEKGISIKNLKEKTERDDFFSALEKRLLVEFNIAS